MNLNEYEAEYCETIEHYSKQLSKLAAENAEFAGLLLKSSRFDDAYFRQLDMGQLEHNCKEMRKLSDEITSLHNKWLGYQSVNYRTSENA